MTWIKTADWENDPETKELLGADSMGNLPKEYSEPLEMFKDHELEDHPAAVVMAQTLIPKSLKHIILAFSALLSPDLPLSRRDHELIAATVSALNKTLYCSNYHAYYLKLATGDEELAKRVREDYRTADLSKKERAMCDYAAKLTLKPSSVDEGDIEELRANGFDDQAILQINLIAAQFNYWNRVADGLGVGRTKSTAAVKECGLATNK